MGVPRKGDKPRVARVREEAAGAADSCEHSDHRCCPVISRASRKKSIVQRGTHRGGAAVMSVGKHRVTSDAATPIVVRLKVPGGFIESRCIKKIVSPVDPIQEVHVGGMGKRQRIGRRWSERERKKETSVDGLRRVWVRKECLSK